MEKTYTTKQGDAWDAIAFRVYGDVKYTGFLMQANFPHLDTFVFDAGWSSKRRTCRRTTTWPTRRSGGPPHEDTESGNGSDLERRGRHQQNGGLQGHRDLYGRGQRRGGQPEISMNDRDRQWTTAWMPKTGDTLTAAIKVYDWDREGDNRTLDCGFLSWTITVFRGGPLPGPFPPCRCRRTALFGKQSGQRPGKRPPCRP